MNSSLPIPEGYILLPLLFLFPYLLARKDKFNFEEIMHSYMQDTEMYVIKLYNKVFNKKEVIV